MDCAVLRLFLEKFRRDARIKRGGVGYAETYSYTPPLVFFNTSHAQHFTHHHTNGTATLNRTTQRLPHSHALTSRLQFCLPHQFPPLPHSCPLCLSLHSCQLQCKVLLAVFNISTACVVCLSCFILCISFACVF